MLTSGTRLGPYEIGGSLGAGGMGEFYRATDTRLKRDVAIKVLPAAFTADPERLARFEREAQLLAQELARLANPELCRFGLPPICEAMSKPGSPMAGRKTAALSKAAVPN